jgi:hypothetical protein
VRFGTALALAALAVALAPETAGACPVCFSASDESRLSFLYTAIAMTGMPLAMIGGGAYWLARRARALDADPGPPR